MTAISERLIREVPPDIISRISGLPLKDLTPPSTARELSFLEGVMQEISPAYLAAQRAAVQAAEIYLISHDATAIGEEFRRKGLPTPEGFAVLTAGFNPPKDAIEIGTYGQGAFEGFPSPEIKGHPGKAYASIFGGKPVMYLKGRAHPTEWSGETYGNMIVAHPLRVVQEMARRQRARNGINPPVLLSYLTGVAEGHAMNAGALGIILDDSEGTNLSHPGFGSVSLMDEYVGAHFQPKMGRASDPDLARLLKQTANRSGVRVYPVGVYGTPGATEYQSFSESAAGEVIFERARSRGLGEYAEETLGAGSADDLSLLFDMGITSELATLRQTHPGEENMRFLAVGLATDVVGGLQSLSVDHDEVVRRAFETTDRNTDLVEEFFKDAMGASGHRTGHRTDHSIQAKLARL